jgi:hypothetical protein
MSEITFRYLTPIFRFPKAAEPPFTHSGRYKEAAFFISLKWYEWNRASFDELLKYATEAQREALQEQIYGISRPPVHIHGLPNWFLIIDVIQPYRDELRVAGNTAEAEHIWINTLNALQLHTLKGLFFHYSFCFRSPPTPHGSYMVRFPNVNQYGFPHVKGDSHLPESEHTSCQATLNRLLHKTWHSKETFDKVLQLAMAYHRITFNLEDANYAFLILMVACESLFKGEEENDGVVGQRISQLISQARNERKQILKAFTNGPTSFYALRNKIAHGDPGLDHKRVVGAYPKLYHYVTKAIIELIAIPDGVIDPVNDYYDEINAFAKKRYDAIARKSS